MIVALVSDLLFESKISTTARLLGVPVQIHRRVDATRAAADAAALVILDLNADGGVLALARSIKQSRPATRVVGYLSHVQADLARAAKAAGLDEVLSRSRFTETLPDLLQACAAVEAPAPAPAAPKP